MDMVTAIFVACFVTGLAGILAAAFVTPNRHLGHGDSWISFAIGALAGTALLELVPEAWEVLGATQGALLLLVLASACCFALDRLFHCRQAVHAHTASCFLVAGTQESPRGKRAWILLVGDFLHSLVDGSLIAAAFSTGVMFGVLMTGAIILHEIPRKCATTLMLVRFGRTRGRALILGTISSLGILAGGAAAWGSLSSMSHVTPWLLSGAAAMIMYVVLVELMPVFRSGWRALLTYKQAGFMLLGSIVVSGTHLLL